MAHGTARAAATACLGLIALQAAGTRGGAGRIASLLADANSMVARVLDPNVPAIPDRRTGASSSGTPGALEAWSAASGLTGTGTASAGTLRGAGAAATNATAGVAGFTGFGSVPDNWGSWLNSLTPTP